MMDAVDPAVVLDVHNLTLAPKLLLMSAGWCVIGGLFVTAIWAVLARQIWLEIVGTLLPVVADPRRYFASIRVAWVLCGLGGVVYAGFTVGLALMIGLIDRGLWTYGQSLGLLILGVGFAVCLAAGATRAFSGWLYTIYWAISASWMLWIWSL